MVGGKISNIARAAINPFVSPCDVNWAEAAKLIVIPKRMGRTANRIVLFANFAAMAEQQGHTVVNVTFHSYARMFDSTRRDIYCRYPAASRRSWLDVVPGVANATRRTRLLYHAIRLACSKADRLPVFGKNIVTVRERSEQGLTSLESPEFQEQIRDSRIVVPVGWTFRAPGWVERHAEPLRRYFQPIREYREAAHSAVDRMRREADVVVGVHIRQGDYRVWKNGRCYFHVEQYAHWMCELAEQFPGSKVAFLVCSDEPRNAKEFPGLTVGLGAGSVVGDLYALANCDFLLGPLGTFSQWASFYGNTPLLQLRSEHDRIERSDARVSFLSEIP